MPPPVAIIGAGLAGLSAARYLKLHDVPFILYESSRHTGGLARSHVDEEGFVYDFGAHFINNRLAAAVGISAECRDVTYYGESVLLGGRIYKYPFGLLRKPRFLKDGIVASVKGLMVSEETACNAAIWFRKHYGNSLADEVALPLLEAWSGAHANDLASSVGSKFTNNVGYTLYLKAMSRLSKRAIGIGYSHEMEEHPGVWHVYPTGGVARICERLADEVKDSLFLESPVEKIIVERDHVRAVCVRGKTQEVAAVVSTMPAPILAKVIEGTSALEEVKSFLFRPMVFVNLKYSTRPILPDTVVWVPEKGYPFFRLTETAHSMPWLAPEGQTMITCDIGDEVKGPFWSMADQELGELCDRAVKQLYPRASSRYRGCRVLRTATAYPVFLDSYEHVRKKFADGTGIQELYSIGRNGEFAHILMEDVYWRTLKKMGALIRSRQSNGRSLVVPNG